MIHPDYYTDALKITPSLKPGSGAPGCKYWVFKTTHLSIRAPNGCSLKSPVY